MAIKALDERHKRAAEMLLAGTPKTVIADTLELNRDTLYGWLKDPLFQEYLARLIDEVESARRARLLPVNLTALDLVHETLKNELRKLRTGEADAERLPVVVDAARKLMEMEHRDRGVSAPNRRERGEGAETPADLGAARREVMRQLDALTGAVSPLMTEDEGSEH